MNVRARSADYSHRAVYNSLEMSEPWYAEGLRFTCQQCHHCCRGSQPGWVYVTRRRVQAIADSLGLSASAFRKRYLTRDEEGEPALVLKPNGDCVFWDEGCTIYPVRPRQCRTFPFWRETLASRESWEELKSFCHGIDEGQLYPLEAIRAVTRGRATGASLNAAPRDEAAR